MQFYTHFPEKMVSFMLAIVCRSTTSEIKVEIMAKNEHRLQVLCNSV